MSLVCPACRSAVATPTPHSQATLPQAKRLIERNRRNNARMERERTGGPEKLGIHHIRRPDVAPGMPGMRKTEENPMTIGTTYTCVNCPQEITWTPSGGWRHADGNQHCDDGRRTFAAPGGDRHGCGATWENDGLLAACEGPADGHRDHAAPAAIPSGPSPDEEDRFAPVGVFAPDGTEVEP